VLQYEHTSLESWKPLQFENPGSDEREGRKENLRGKQKEETRGYQIEFPLSGLDSLSLKT
jgi:hypothetical protein